MSRKNKLSREQKFRLEELESNLFGSLTAASNDFGKELEEQSLRLPSRSIQDGKHLSAQDGEDPTLLIWEDKRPAELTLSPGETSEQELDQDEELGYEEEIEDIPADGEAELLHASENQSHGQEDSNDEEETNSASRRASGAEAGTSEPQRPVWEDPDDETLEVDIAAVNRLRKLRASESEVILSGKEYAKRLKQQHLKLNPRTSWASLKRGKKRRRGGNASDLDSDQEDALEAVQQGASNLLTGREVLSAGLLETTRLKDANMQEPSKAAVQTLQFHPDGKLLFTGGLDKSLRFFQIDGVKNPKVQTIYLADLPIHKASFAIGGTQIIASGRRKHFYTIDLAASRVERISHLTSRDEKSLENFAVSSQQPLVAFLGARGHLPLFSLQSRQIVGQLRMAGSVSSATFTDDGSQLIASGGDGVIHTWDMRTMQCFSRFVDEGALWGRSLASSPGQQFIAAGSDAGFVNIYNHKAAVEAGTAKLGEPTSAKVVRPIKSLKNLVTAVDNLVFSPDGQILAMASHAKKDALRMVHMGSMTTFSNWPTSRSPLHMVHSMAFSPNGGFFAAGNAKGKVLLYRMHHYSQA